MIFQILFLAMGSIFNSAIDQVVGSWQRIQAGVGSCTGSLCMHFARALLASFAHLCARCALLAHVVD